MNERTATKSGESYEIDGDLELQTREIARAMEGPQPSEQQWDMFFMRGSGSMSSDIDGKMKLAHTIAKNLKLSS